MKKITGELQSGHVKRECLLRQDNFVSNSGLSSFESRRLAWEASTLPLSYTRNHDLHVNITLKRRQNQVVSHLKITKAQSGIRRDPQ